MNEDKRSHDDSAPEADARWSGTDEHKSADMAGDIDGSKEEPVSAPSSEASPVTPEPAAATPVTNEPAGSDEEGKGAQGIMTLIIILVVLALAAAAWFLFFSGEGSGNNLLSNNESGNGDDNAAAVTRSYPEVIAVVNGEEVGREELIEAVANLGQQAQTQGLNMGDAETQQLVEDQALTTLINTTLLLQTAEEIGLTVSEQEIDAEIEGLKSQLGGEEGFAERLETMGLSETDVREDIREQLLINQYMGTVDGLTASTVTDEEIQAFYDQVSAGGQELPPLEDVRAQIEQQLRSQAEQAALSEHISELRADAEIEVLISTEGGADTAE